ncbi:MAG TPA: 1-acyl-sn-glycerol-3-phosphate acyltransferase [Coleofasciculaceae cyanobacterium]|jgi:1-acyl-sn-glycerol-3-phosphate acyltransferase
MPDSSKVDLKFLPPKRNPLLTRLIQSVAYLVVYFGYKIRAIIDEDDLANLKAIAEHRVVYLPNHSTLDDGLVMFLFSARIGQLFHYVVAYEAFQGVIGKLMQRVGAYSIRRGVGDRYSIVQTLDILQQPQCKLVIFPEGGCSYQNDTVMPFRSGAIELSFKAIEKLFKHNGIIPDFYLVPVSLKYVYPNVTDTQLEQALSRLETALSLKPAQADYYLRLREIATQVLKNLEVEYHQSPINSTNLNPRIKHLKKRMLNYCEEKLELASLSQIPERDRVYKIQSVLSSLADSAKKPNLNYEHIYQTTVRLLNFDAIYDGYVAEKPTPERYFATIDRLEREVFKIDRPKLKGRRQAIVKIGTPINLKEHWQVELNNSLKPQSYSRQKVIDNLTQAAQQAVQAYLD